MSTHIYTYNMHITLQHSVVCHRRPLRAVPDLLPRPGHHPDAAGDEKVYSIV